MVTKQMPAGTVADTSGPAVLEENSVVGAAPAGPEPTASATTPNTAVAAAPTRIRQTSLMPHDLRFPAGLPAEHPMP